MMRSTTMKAPQASASKRTPTVAPPKRASVVSRFSLESMGSAAVHFLAHPSRALAEAIYAQPVVNTAAHSGMDLGATLGVVAGGVAGYLGYQLKQQLDMSSKTTSELLQLSQVRTFLEGKLKESEKEVTVLKAAVAQALADLRTKETEFAAHATTMQQQVQEMQLKLGNAVKELSLAQFQVARLQERARLRSTRPDVAEVETLRESFQHLLKEKEGLRAALTTAEATLQTREQFETNLRNAQEGLSAADVNAAKLVEEINGLNNSVAGLQQQVLKEQAATAAVRSEMESLAAKKALMETALATTCTQVEGLEAAVASLQAAAADSAKEQGEMQELLAAKATLESQLSLLQLAFNDMEANTQSLKAAQEATAQELAQKQEALAQAARALEEASQYRQDSERLAEEVERYKVEAQAQQQRAVEQLEREAQLERELQAALQRNSELEAALSVQQQVLIPSLQIAEEELSSDTIAPVKSLRAGTRARRSVAAPAPAESQEESAQTATAAPQSADAVAAAPAPAAKVAVARSASTRSRVAKVAKATDEEVSAGKAPESVEEATAAAPVKKTRAARKPKAVVEGGEGAEEAEVKPLRAARKSRKAAAEAVLEVEEERAAVQAEAEPVIKSGKVARGRKTA